MELIFFAKEVEVKTSEQTLSIVWGDGHRSVYPLEGLRMACPCVECAGGHENMGQGINRALFFLPPKNEMEVVALKEVGSYAMQITWGDGHDTGIYRWQALREACPCEECANQ